MHTIINDIHNLFAVSSLVVSNVDLSVSFLAQDSVNATSGVELSVVLCAGCIHGLCDYTTVTPLSAMFSVAQCSCDTGYEGKLTRLSLYAQ